MARPLLTFAYLPDPEAHRCWDGIVELLQPAADYGGIAVKEEPDLVWIVFEGATLYAALTTRLVPGDEAEIRLIGGARSGEWVRQADGVLSQWARNCGAWRLTARGRKGWGRLTRNLGWQPVGEDDAGRTLYAKEL